MRDLLKRLKKLKKQFLNIVFPKTKKHVKPLIYKTFTRFFLEASPRLELGSKDFADLRLTTWL